MNTIMSHDSPKSPLARIQARGRARARRREGRQTTDGGDGRRGERARASIVSLCVSLLSLSSRGGARETEARARVAVDFGWAIERIETNRRRARRGRARGVGVGYGTGDET